MPVSDQFAASRAAFARPGGGAHWSLLLWEPRTPPRSSDAAASDAAAAGGAFHHFDSARGTNAAAARAVAAKLVAVLTGGGAGSAAEGTPAATVTECACPQQDNGHDCGAFALGCAEALGGEEKRAESQKGAAGSRRARHEAAVARHFAEHGGPDFAPRLRRRVAADVRALASAVEG